MLHMCSMDNATVLPGLCQDFQCACGVNGWTVNRLHGDRRTRPGPGDVQRRLGPREIASCVSTYCEVRSKSSLGFLGSGQRCEAAAAARSCSLHPQRRPKPDTWQLLWTPSHCLFSISLAWTSPFIPSYPGQGDGSAPFNHQCGHGAGLADSVMLSVRTMLR